MTCPRLVAVEEGLEMAGAIVFIYGLLRYLADHHARLMVNDLAGHPLPAPNWQTMAGRLLRDAPDPPALAHRSRVTPSCSEPRCAQTNAVQGRVDPGGD